MNHNIWLLFITLLCCCISPLGITSANAKVFIVLMEGDPFVSRKSNTSLSRNLDDDVMLHKERIGGEHDTFLESLLKPNSYRKLYSYAHLQNGFAVHVNSEEAISLLRNATGVRSIHEDVKLEKMTTHTPDYLGISQGVWPTLGGAMNSGNGIVIGLIDTGINPFHPSFASFSSFNTNTSFHNGKFLGNCAIGEQFPSTSCGGKIVGAQYFAHGATAAGEFNATRDYASPFDADGHGSHTASVAAGNYAIPVIVDDFNYGYASGMAPGARIAVYKALYTFGGYMSDVVAAIDQAVVDGVDILSLSVGPSTVPPGSAAFLSVLEMQLLFATKAGVVVVQAAGNGGPTPSSMLSFSPWIASAAASLTDRKYNCSISLGDGQSLSGIGLSPPTPGNVMFPIAAAADVSRRNTTVGSQESCQSAATFVPSLARGKLVICIYTFDFDFESASILRVAETMRSIDAAGFIMTMDPDVGSSKVKGTVVALGVPAIILNDMETSAALWDYYNSRTFRTRNGRAVAFTATGRIYDGRRALYSGQAPVVASYSSRGPDVNNAFMQTADVLKPTILAPGSSIWAAWSPNSEGDQYMRGQNFALISGTSMAAPHIAGVAALIKHKYPGWSPSAVISAMMTTADVHNQQSGQPILVQQANSTLIPATPFDFGAGSINATRALNPGLVFITNFKQYIQFLCAVPGVDDDSVRRATGLNCPKARKLWCSDLNTASLVISNLVGSRKVKRRVTNVGNMDETYIVNVEEPQGINVTIVPMVFKLARSSSRVVKILVEAVEATNAYSFGAIVMMGNRGHVVRVPVAVYVSSVLGQS